MISHYQKDLSIQMPIWLKTFQELEASISLANFAYINPDYTFPEFIHSADYSLCPILEAKDLGHPLILPKQKICNRFSINNLGEVYIITGSNMAGKSTFVKTIGINLALAYAGGPVNASIFNTYLFRLHTCIKISDSIADGFSYFYAEVKCLKSLLDRINSDHPYPVLYLIDEIFRGTNNRERLIGSQTYIQKIAGKRSIGLIATHDLELANLEKKNDFITNYHFRDEVRDGKLVFDYKIRLGPSPTTNALKIMEMEGLPVDK
jgi:DNA mismatch repair ATPase MutS